MLKTLKTSTLLILITLVISSCSKMNIEKSGQFSNIVEKEARTIANSDDRAKLLKSFNEFQDTKQLLVYCHLNSKHVSACFRDKFEKSFQYFKQSNTAIQLKDVNMILSEHSFKKVSNRLDFVEKKVLSLVDKKINKLVTKRVNYCANNAKKMVKKCLKQFLKRDSFAVTNNFQREHQAMNGQEYIYTKNIIKKNLEKRLMAQKDKLKARRSTSSL